MLVALASKTDPPLKFEEKWIKAKVIKVTFKNIYKCSLKQAEIPMSGPHYVEGDKLVGDNYSEKPVVYPIKKDSIIQAQVVVNMQVKNMSGTATLRGKIGSHVYEGQIPIEDGDSSPIVVKLVSPTPKKLQWKHGNINWSIITTDDRTFRAGKSVAELLFVLDDPSKRIFFSSAGVWVEALRFLYEDANIARIEKPESAVSKATKASFDKYNRTYDRDGGYPKFGGSSGNFLLKDYLSSVKKTVNCYDQANAVVVFSGALGIEVKELYMSPFGYLKATALVGIIGNCNNPFTAGVRDYFYSEHFYGSLELELDINNKNRSLFGNHLFCEYKAKIYDACAGPKLGNYDRAGYVGSSVDSATLLNNEINRQIGENVLPGEETDIYEVPTRHDPRIKPVINVS